MSPVADANPRRTTVAARPPRRRTLTRIAAMVAIAFALAASAAGCVGQLGRNDDHVGPTSVRPDAQPRS